MASCFGVQTRDDNESCFVRVTLLRRQRQAANVCASAASTTLRSTIVLLAHVHSRSQGSAVLISGAYTHLEREHLLSLWMMDAGAHARDAPHCVCAAVLPCCKDLRHHGVLFCCGAGAAMMWLRCERLLLLLLLLRN